MIRLIGDFVDEGDRMGGKNRRFNFRKASRWPIRKYMDGQIKVICAKVGREMVGWIGGSCENSEMKWVISGVH